MPLPNEFIGRVLASLSGVVFLGVAAMMNTLLESKPRRQRSAGGTIFSVVFHSAVIFFAVYATAQAGIADERVNRAERVAFVKLKKDEPPPPVEKKKEPPPPPK